ncbi:MAG: hypothetical protein AAGJ18_24300 [Bacteroidota bacterium]
MPLKKHSNLHSNSNLHHLYVVYDLQEREIYKFGISDNPITQANCSKRLQQQLTLFNKVVGWKRFEGRILLFAIEGRRKARVLEDEWIMKFFTKRNRFPRGNEKHQFLK